MATECTVAFCPLNMRAFDQLKEKTGDIELAAFCSKILFHLQNTKITKVGEKCITRSREQFASWFQFSKRKTDNFIKKLSQLDLINKCLGSWYGSKSVFLYKDKAANDLTCCPVNTVAINQLIDLTGSLKSALILSFIIYRFSNTKLVHENKRWCALRVDDIAQWGLISRKSAGTIINSLVELGLIERKYFNWKGRAISHFTLTSKVKIQRIENTQSTQANMNSINQKNLAQQGSAPNDTPSWVNRATPIKISQNKKITNNKEAKPLSFELIDKNLSFNQERYLKKAIENTIKRYNLLISNPKTLFEELKYSFSCLSAMKNPKANEKITFREKVSQFMCLLSQKRWRTPFGFGKYSSYGKKVTAQSREKDQERQGQQNREGKQYEYYEKLVNRKTRRQIKSTTSPIKDLMGKYNKTPLASTTKQASITEQALTYIERFSALSTEAQEVGLQSTLMPRLKDFIDNGADSKLIKVQLSKVIHRSCRFSHDCC